MKENKKHIDRLFQDKFKDFKATPDPAVWERIESSLHETSEEGPKAIPLWWKVVGIAAGLLVLLGVGNMLYNQVNTTDIPNTNNTITNTKTSPKEQPSTNVSQTESEQNDNTAITNTAVATQNNSEFDTTENTQDTNTTTSSAEKTLKTSNKNSSLYHNNTVVSSTSNTNKTNKRSILNANTNASSNSDTNANGVNASNSTVANTYKATNGNTNNVSNNGVTNNSYTTVNSNSNSDANNSNTYNNSVANTNSTFTPSQNNRLTIALFTDFATTKDYTVTITADLDLSHLDQKQSIYDALAEDSNDVKNSKQNKWEVYASVAPVFYDNLGKRGSHIDQQFVNNTKNGEFNTAYNLNVGYAISDRFTIRTGVSQVNLSYDTANVILYENVNTPNNPNNEPIFKNLNMTNSSISMISADNVFAQQTIGLLPGQNAAISQRLQYIEVPLEAAFKLSRKRLGVNVIAGVSSYFLSDNKVVSEFEGRKTKIGEANNINNVSFSGNFGLGFDYKFSKTFKLNIEPTFKYQINAYNNTFGDFRPYIFGINTGFSYKF